MFGNVKKKDLEEFKSQLERDASQKEERMKKLIDALDEKTRQRLSQFPLGQGQSVVLSGGASVSLGSIVQQVVLHLQPLVKDQIVNALSGNNDLVHRLVREIDINSLQAKLVESMKGNIEIDKESMTDSLLEDIDRDELKDTLAGLMVEKAVATMDMKELIAAIADKIMEEIDDHVEFSDVEEKVAEHITENLQISMKTE